MNRDQILVASKLQKALDEIDSEQIYTSIISFEEQMRGWLAFIAKCKTAHDQIFAYARLHISLESYRNTQVLDFDEKAVAVFEQLKSQKVRIGTMDLKIASIAIANHAILVSRNLADFERVPGLAIQDWT